MERKRRFLLIAIGIVAVAAVAWFILRAPSHPEPAFQGKPLSQWVAVYDPTNTTRRNPELQQAQYAIRELGTNAIPPLLRMLETHDTGFKLWIVNMAGKLHIETHFVPEQRRYERAAMALEVLGPRAESAVPELIEIYDHNPSTNAQPYIGRVLGVMGPPAKAAVPSLLRSLTNSDYATRMTAVYALGKIHAEPAKVVPALIPLLQDTNASGAVSAAYALGDFGPEAKAAVPALVKYIEGLQAVKLPAGTTGIDRRMMAIDSLRRIDREAADKVDPKAPVSYIRP